ncbi:MAG: AraC family transcriptional regulator [Flammeovirgaceae bacterium]
MADFNLKQRLHHHDFTLQSMGEIFQQAKGKADVPHRHGYYTVLLVDHAKGKHVIDYLTYPFEENQVHFVSPGQVHQVHVEEEPTGWVITFSRDFLAENNIPESFISNINLFKQFGDSSPLQIDHETKVRLLRIVAEMKKCLPEELLYRNRALGALVQLFLIYCNNCCLLDTQQLDEENAGVCILRDFKTLVDNHFHEWHKVNTYADEISISSKHLSYTVKDITGKTAKEFIQDRLVLEAKRLLIHTELTIKEIAYQIGFEEPLHFSAFFKKHTKCSPTVFREKKSL